jgi:hypothetical protein
MATAWLKWLTVMFVPLVVVVVVAPGCEEPTDPSLEPPEIETPATTTAPARAPSPTVAGAAAPSTPRTPAEYRKAAEAGDVPSMLLLARSYESLGQRPRRASGTNGPPTQATRTANRLWRRLMRRRPRLRTPRRAAQPRPLKSPPPPAPSARRAQASRHDHARAGRRPVEDSMERRDVCAGLRRYGRKCCHVRRPLSRHDHLEG